MYQETIKEIGEIAEAQSDLLTDIEKEKQRRQGSPLVNACSDKINLGRDGLPASDDWATPPELIKKLEKEFDCKFYDPCPLGGKEIAPDGLRTEWKEWNFLNPPYNRISKPLFIQKSFIEWKKGKNVILLIPAATGTADFAKFIFDHAEIRFFVGRIAFQGVNTKGEFVTTKKGKHDSMLCIFRAGVLEPPRPSLMCGKTFEKFVNLPF